MTVARDILGELSESCVQPSVETIHTIYSVHSVCMVHWHSSGVDTIFLKINHFRECLRFLNRTNSNSGSKTFITTLLDRSDKGKLP